MNKMAIMNFVEETLVPRQSFPKFKAGDTVTVHYKIKEGNKERIQQYQGVVLQRSGAGVKETFTVRKMSGSIGVERIFPIASPFIDKIILNKVGVVRRARIFYLRDLTGKKARIREKRLSQAQLLARAADAAPKPAAVAAEIVKPETVNPE
jgi:large subunit ribosomal protein L19